jgi:plastocyanin
MLLLLGVFLGLPAGVWVFRHRKGPPGSVSARDGLRTRYGIFTVLVSGILLGAGIAAEAAYLGATSSGASSGADLTPQANVTVAAENFFFVPATLTIPSDRLVEVTVINKDNARHTFTYTVYKGRADERTYNHELLPLTTTKFTMLVLAPGSVHFWCIPHEAMGMVGDFTVT